MRALFLGLTVAGLVILTGSAWVQRSCADPCFDTAAKSVACDGTTSLCQDQGNEMDCVLLSERIFLIADFSCGSVKDSKTNCDPKKNQMGGAELAPCFEAYFCYWDDSTETCIRYLNPYDVQYKAVYVTNKCK